MDIHKRYVVDDQGNPKEVIIPWEDFQKIEEMLGLDLDSKAVEDLKEAIKDRAAGNKDAYTDLDSI